MLINCVAYQEGAKFHDIPIADISEYVCRPEFFVWVALRDAEPEELRVMQEEFGLHPLAVEDAHHGHQRPKIEEYGETLFVVMHLLEMQEGHLVRGEVDIFVGSNFILSVRNQSTQDFLGVRQRCEREQQLFKQGSSFVLYALMDAVVDRYFPIVDALESELEAIEEKIFTKGSARPNIQGLYELKRKVGVVRHAVVPLMDAVGDLIGGRVSPLGGDSREYFRDVFDHLTRINASIDTIRDTVATAIQANLGMIAIEDSEVNKRLAAWAGIFAAATAFAGVWGMNFRLMPELQWKYGYPMALGIIVATCLALYMGFRRARWL